jgi:hypothetical protein
MHIQPNRYQAVIVALSAAARAERSNLFVSRPTVVTPIGN